MIRPRLVSVALALLLVAADAPATKPMPPDPPKQLTVQERRLLLGVAARAELVRLQAQRELAALEAEQTEVLGVVAARLGLTLEQLRTEHTINLGDSSITPKPKAASAAPAPAPATKPAH